MAATRERLNLEELERLGTEISASQIAPRLSDGDRGMFVAVDTQTGKYEIGTDEQQVLMGLKQRLPESKIWLMRVGFPAVHRLRLRG